MAKLKKYVCLIFIKNVHTMSVGRNPGGGEGRVARGGEYTHIRTARVCAARKSPFFSALAPPKESTFSTWAAPKDPLLKNIQFFVPLFRPGQMEKTLV